LCSTTTSLPSPNVTDKMRPFCLCTGSSAPRRTTAPCPGTSGAPVWRRGRARADTRDAPQGPSTAAWPSRLRSGTLVWARGLVRPRAVNVVSPQSLCASLTSPRPAGPAQPRRIPPRPAPRLPGHGRRRLGLRERPRPEEPDPHRSLHVSPEPPLLLLPSHPTGRALLTPRCAGAPRRP
jgi:hypothetical protein